jgi:mannose-6-phosphate isomerase-like protein (cupin superfamily)
MIMAVLGGNDAGGGVIWAPQVITDAKDYGLILGKNGKLYDTKRGQSLPEGVVPMPLLTDEQLKAYPEPTTADVIPNHIARYLDLMALSDHQPAKVIGAEGKLRDRPGFEVEFLSRGSIPDAPYKLDRHEILMPVRGYWRLTWGNGSTVLNPGDTAAIPPGLEHSLTPAVTGEASLYRVMNTDDPAGATGRLL